MYITTLSFHVLYFHLCKTSLYSIQGQLWGAFDLNTRRCILLICCNGSGALEWEDNRSSCVWLRLLLWSSRKVICLKKWCCLRLLCLFLNCKKTRAVNCPEITGILEKYLGTLKVISQKLRQCVLQASDMWIRKILTTVK